MRICSTVFFQVREKRVITIRVNENSVVLLSKGKIMLRYALFIYDITNFACNYDSLNAKQYV